MSPSYSERKLIFLLGSIQFINILDFMMVMPLGPDFAQAIGIPNSHLGVVGGSYTAAAAVSGLVSSRFLDRFDRKKALMVALLGLVVGTAAGGFSVGLYSMLASRIFAGIFGGPASSLALSVVADVIPPERRGKAMGAVMGAFAAASVFGVPAGLELARLGGWRMPFFAVAAAGLFVLLAGTRLLPNLTGHIQATRGPIIPMRTFLGRPTVLLMLTATGTLMLANFAIIPNFAAYYQFNLDYPRDRLGLLYMVGGLCSFFAMRMAGRAADRYGSTAVAAFGTFFWSVSVVFSFLLHLPAVPIMLLFVFFMVAGSFRMVPMTSLSSRVPQAGERARFLSLQSAVQHIGSALGAMAAALFLQELPDGKLLGMDRVALGALALAAFLPLLVWQVERRVRGEESKASTVGT